MRNSDDNKAQQEEQEIERLESVMRDVPRGALAVAGIAVALLMVGWFFLYLGIFLPRGSVG